MNVLSKNFVAAEFFRGGKPFDPKCLFHIALTERIEKKLVRPVLQPLRDHLGVAITITSGFRSCADNRKAAGAENSHHLYQLDRSAADFTCSKMGAAWEWLKQHRDRFCYAYWDRDREFIHVSGLSDTDRRVGWTWVLPEKEKGRKDGVF